MSNSKKIAASLLGQNLSEQECDLLSDIVTTRTLQAGEMLFDEGTQDNLLSILITGKLEVLKVLPGGNTFSMDFLKEGTMAGELAFIDGLPHTMRVIAKKDSDVLMLHREAFEAYIESQPMLTYQVMRAILRYSFSLQNKINAKYLEMYRMVQNQYTAHY